MNIAVIAASGRLGRAFVDKALAAGHTVRAGVRRLDSLPAHANLTIVKCDATNHEEVTSLLRGQDVVVSCIGHTRGSASNVQTNATKILVKIMDDMNIKRFVTVTGTGARFPGDKIGLVDRFLNTAVEIVDPSRVNDGREHLKVLEASDVGWTVIRVLKLQNTSQRAFTLKLNGPTKWFVGRTEAAQAMLQVITDNSFVRQSPIISRFRK
jgi:putative NADH-flavin reductase